MIVKGPLSFPTGHITIPILISTILPVSSNVIIRLIINISFSGCPSLSTYLYSTFRPNRCYFPQNLNYRQSNPSASSGGRKSVVEYSLVLWLLQFISHPSAAIKSHQSNAISLPIPSFGVGLQQSMANPKLNNIPDYHPFWSSFVLLLLNNITSIASAPQPRHRSTHTHTHKDAYRIITINNLIGADWPLFPDQMCDFPTMATVGIFTSSSSFIPIGTLLHFGRPRAE